MMGERRHARDAAVVNEKQFMIPQFILHASATPVLERIPIKRELLNKSKMCLQRRDSRKLEMICPISGKGKPLSQQPTISSGYFGGPVELSGRGVSRCKSDGRPHSSKDVVYYNYLQRDDNKERVDLERQGLSRLPYIEDPHDEVRILNMQGNAIERVTNLGHFNRLVCLDLYDNQLERIEGVDMLHSLRVLILGKNRIKKIENLEGLTRLGLLDLHGNQISVIENLSSLVQLRVLNVSCNFVSRVTDLSSLGSLVELNLKKNRIKSLSGLDNLPCLEKLYLASNKISKLEDVSCILRCFSLQELSLDNNPLHGRESNVRQTILVSLHELNVLDSRRITEEQRRQAETWSRREEEKRRESSKMAAYAQELNKKRFQAILNARKKWESSASHRGNRLGPDNESGMSARTKAESLPGNSYPSLPGLANREMSSSPSPDPRSMVGEPREIQTTNSQRAAATHLPSAAAKEEENEEEHLGQVLSKGIKENEGGPAAPDKNLESAKNSAAAIARDLPPSQPALTTNQNSRCRSKSRSKSVSSNLARDHSLASSEKHTERSSATISTNQDSLSELDGDALKLFGSGSLDAFDRNWGIQAAGAVTEISFCFIDFDEIVPVLPKIRIRFPNACSFKFCSTNLSTLNQLNALSSLKRLEGLTIGSEGNQLTLLTSWRAYAVFRLSHLGLCRINGEEVSAADRSTAERMFSPLASLISSSIPRWRLQLLLGDRKKLSEERTSENLEEISRAVLSYDPKVKTKTASSAGGPSAEQDSTPKQPRAPSDPATSAREFVRRQLEECTRVNSDLERLEECWQSMLERTVSRMVAEMLPLREYSEASYERFCKNLFADCCHFASFFSFFYSFLDCYRDIMFHRAVHSMANS